MSREVTWAKMLEEIHKFTDRSIEELVTSLGMSRIHHANEPERITGVATRLDGLEDATYLALPPPYRHHDLIWRIKQLGLKDPGPHAQGFVTSWGRWVSREDACLIAKAVQQVSSPKRCDPQNQLFSEDLW